MSFIRVPNQIIKYSCSVNHIVLPVYLYSAIHCNPNNDNIVDTNLAHISETFAPNEDVRRKIHLKVEDVIRLLSSDVEDVDLSITEENREYIESELLHKSEVIKGFSACFDGALADKIDKTTRIQYQFLDRDIKMENGFTMLDYEEYFYLINTITKINEDKGKTTKSNKWNLIDLINFYMYLKMRIIYFHNTAVAKNSMNITMHDSVMKMASVMKVGNKTITKYTNELIELGLIHTKMGNFKEGKSTEYSLSDNWKRNRSN